MPIGDMNVMTSGDSEMGRSVAVRARLGLALEQIDQYAPRVGVRMRRDVSAIYLWRTGGINYNQYTRMIGVDIRQGLSGQVEDLALALVHEATHARQFAMGVTKRPRGAFERRLEAHAVAQSIAFAERLPPGAWRKPTLADLDREWWSREQREARMAEAAKEIGTSPRLLRVLVAVTRRLGVAR
jgi:hypothetical protein